MAHTSDFPEPQENDVKVCVGCDASIETKGLGDTLVAIRTGWRLTRGPDAGGRITLEWRCPKCWARYRPKAP